MARPLKTGLEYFPHDTDAVNDPKIQSIMAVHGPGGYSFYFIMLEKVFRAENGRITCGKLPEIAGYSRIIGIKPTEFKAMMDTAIQVGLFVSEGEGDQQTITSVGVQKRIKKVYDDRESERKRKEDYLRRKEEERTKEEEILKDLKEKEKEKEKAKRGKPPENPRKTIEVILPDWINKELWQAFKEKRKELKKPLSGKAEELAIKKLTKLKEQGHDPSELLSESIINSWQSFFPKTNNNGKKDILQDDTERQKIKDEIRMLEGMLSRCDPADTKRQGAYRLKIEKLEGSLKL